jgi:hypothetical protein
MRLGFLGDPDASREVIDSRTVHAKRSDMARKTVLVSDLTGREIADRNAATVTIRYADARRGQIVLDVNAEEVDELASKGRKQARRGRRPSAAAA